MRAEAGGVAAKGSLSALSMIWLVDVGPLRASAESVASIEPVAACRLPNARLGRDVRRVELRFAILNRRSFSFSGEVKPPSLSFFLKMLVNTFLRLPEGAGNRDLSPLSPVSNAVDRRGDVRGEVMEANVRGRLEKRDEMELLEVE